MIWRLGVAGDPVDHSLSPQLHEAGLALCGLDGSSDRVSIARKDAPRLRELLGARYDALSVTMPLKEVAATLCDDLDEAAAATGVVNSLLARDGRVFGASTDGAGLLDALAWSGHGEVAGAVVAVLGAGGAARAIVHALVGAGARQVVVSGRTPAHVTRLVDRYPGVVVAAPGRDVLDLVVNTVPVTGRAAPELEPGTTGSTVAVDIAYEPRMTPWRARYEAAGCASMNGLAMLVFQAARQMSWWWDRDVDGAALIEVVM